MDIVEAKRNLELLEKNRSRLMNYNHLYSSYAFKEMCLAEDMGYRIQRFEPHAIESGGVIRWIKSQLERIEDGTDQTIPTDGSH